MQFTLAPSKMAPINAKVNTTNSHNMHQTFKFNSIPKAVKTNVTKKGSINTTVVMGPDGMPHHRSVVSVSSTATPRSPPITASPTTASFEKVLAESREERMRRVSGSSDDRGSRKSFRLDTKAARRQTIREFTASMRRKASEAVSVSASQRSDSMSLASGSGPMCTSPIEASDFGEWVYPTSPSLAKTAGTWGPGSTSPVSPSSPAQKRAPPVSVASPTSPFHNLRGSTGTLDDIAPFAAPSGPPPAASDLPQPKSPRSPVLGISRVVSGSSASSTPSGASMPQTPTVPGWHDLARPTGAVGAKRVFFDDNGEVRSVYKVGWESPVLDLEARLHETMYDIAGGRHTFIDLDENSDAPATVLDLGTGSGLWPISQALAWPKAQFVAADLVPCHIDLQTLAAATACIDDGTWESVADRIDFQQYNFLNGLPYDTGAFDMVHLRFVGLGVPENQWAALLDEAVRVLRPGGVLEVVEMSAEPPTNTPGAVKSAWSTMLQSDYIHSNPVSALQSYLPSTPHLVKSTRPVLNVSWDMESPSNAPGALADASMTWIRSALAYRDARLGMDETGARAIKAFAKAAPGKWISVRPHGEQPEEDEERSPRTPVNLAAWVVVKESRTIAKEKPLITSPPAAAAI